MKRAKQLSLLPITFILVLSSSASGQTTIDPNTAKAIVLNNFPSYCMNNYGYYWCMPCYGVQAGGSTSGGCPNPDYSGLANDYQSGAGSFISREFMNYHHIANDYVPSQTLGGCSSCGSATPASLGGSQLATFVLQRRYRSRDLTMPSSFGPGWFSNYDVSLQFAGYGTMIPNPNNPQQLIPGTAWEIELFDPGEDIQQFLYDGLNGDTKDGIYSPIRPTGAVPYNTLNQYLKDVRCYDANQNLVIEPTQGTTAVLTNKAGTKYGFDLINLDMPAPTDAVGWWKFDEGTGTVANDSSGNGSTATLVNNPSWIVGEESAAIEFDGNTAYGHGQQPSYASIGNPTALNFSGLFSISFWVYLNDTSSTQTIIQHGANGSTQQMAVSIGTGGITLNAAYINNNSPHTASVGAPLGSADLQAWVHWAFTYDGANWKCYRNGTFLTRTADAVGATTVNGNWLIACNGQSQPFLNAGLDDLRIFKRALLPDEVGGLAQMPLVCGRLASITDRNGYAVRLTHKSFTAAQLNASPELQWQIDTITDPYGREASFSYSGTQQSGRWAISEIALPNGTNINYNYTAGQLSSVAFADGTTSTFAYGYDSASGCSTMQIFDVAADTTHRNKTVHLSSAYIAPVWSELFKIFPQSAGFGRLVINGSNEVAYLGIAGSYYEGAGRYQYVQTQTEGNVTYACPTFSVANGNSIQIGSGEPTMASYTGTGIEDNQGHQYTYTLDADGYPTVKTWSDNTTEQTTFNQFKQVTRFQDRNPNVTLNTYDANGNLLSKGKRPVRHVRR